MKFKVLQGQYLGTDPRAEDKFFPMTLPQLQEYAREHGVNLEGCKDRRSVLGAILANYDMMFPEGSIIRSNRDLVAKFNGRATVLERERVADLLDAKGNKIRAKVLEEEVVRAPEFAKFELMPENTPMTIGTLLTPQTKPDSDAEPEPERQRVVADADIASIIPESSADATLASMTVAELKQWAAGEEIDLSGAKTKDEILVTIRAALQTA